MEYKLHLQRSTQFLLSSHFRNGQQVLDLCVGVLGPLEHVVPFLATGQCLEIRQRLLLSLEPVVGEDRDVAVAFERLAQVFDAVGCLFC